MKPLAVLPWVAALFLSSALFSHTVALRLLLLALGVILAAAALATERGSLRALPPIWLPFALWAAWSVLSLAWSIEPQRSLLELKNEIFYTSLALWVCYVAAQAPQAARIVTSLVGMAAVAVCSVAVYHYFWGTLGSYTYGWHGGAGNHSCALLTLMPCMILVALRARDHGSSGQWIAWSLAALILVSAYTTLNRTIWLGFALQLLVIGGLVALRRPGGLASRARLIGAMIAVAVVAASIAAVLEVQHERERIGMAAPMQRDPRLALWPEVIERVEARPLTGYGFGRGVMRLSLRDDLQKVELWHAHNVLLDVSLQLGLPGLALLLILLGATLREGWRLARDPNETAAACGIALAAVVAGMLARNMTDMLWVRQNALLYWGVVGVLLGIGRSSATRSR